MPNIKIYNESEGIRELVAVEKFKDITDHIKFFSKVRFVIIIDRLYLMKSQGLDKKKYGIGMKIIAAECENKAKNPLERTDTSFVDFVG